MFNKASRFSKFLCSLNRTAKAETGSLDKSRHASLDTRLSQTRHNKRRPLLHGSTEDREELSDPAVLAIRLFNKVDGDTPPGQNGAEDPEVRGRFHAGLDAGPEGEEADSNGRADSEGCKDAAEDNVTSCRSDCC